MNFNGTENPYDEYIGKIILNWALTITLGDKKKEKAIFDKYLDLKRKQKTWDMTNKLSEKMEERENGKKAEDKADN